MEYNKLVRDKIPEIIAKQGKKVTCRRLEGDELKQALKDKLIEEAHELAQAETKKQMVEEMADVESVLAAIRITHGIDYSDVHIERLCKDSWKGTFAAGQFLERVEEEQQ